MGLFTRRAMLQTKLTADTRKQLEMVIVPGDWGLGTWALGGCGEALAVDHRGLPFPNSLKLRPEMKKSHRGQHYSSY